MAVGNSPDTTLTSIHFLDDDSLLNIFYLYRPAMLDGDEENDVRIMGGKPWGRERWWYTLAHVCERWRNLILGSASYLGVCLVCTIGTPVADMLAQSPPLPLIIDSISEDGITAEDEEAIVLALEQRDRIRRIRLIAPYLDLQKLAMAMDEEYPILEYLILMISKRNTSTVLVLPETLQAPHLRHLLLSNFALPIGSRLLTTAVGLVTLCLSLDHPSAYFPPNTLLQWLSFMPQLETLAISFFFSLPNRDVERQPIHVPNMTHITLPNLRWFAFGGVSAYLEGVFRRITAPRLEMLQFNFFNQLTFSIPRLLQFLDTTENLRFDSARFQFEGELVYVEVYLREEAKTYALTLKVFCRHLDWQVSSVAQIFDALNQIFSLVEHLTLEHKVHDGSSDEHNEVDRTEWHKLLRSFSNVKTLRIGDGLVGELSRCLQLDDGEPSLELLPELQELTYFGSRDTGKAFTSFVQARQNAGRPVTLIHR